MPAPPPASRPPCARAPPTATRRAGRPRLSSQPGAASPRMMAAVLAMFACSAVSAATDTVRQTGVTGSPLRGSRMWCSVTPPRRQRRAAVPEVARPPALMAIIADWPAGGSSGCPVMSWTRTRQPPSGACPATEMSPPRLTSTPQPSRSASRAAARSAARAFAVAPRSSRTPAGTVSSRASWSSRICRQLGRLRTLTCSGGPSWLTSSKSRSYPSAVHGRGDRGIHIAIGDLRRVQRDGDGVGEHGTDGYGRPGRPLGHGKLGVRPEAAAGQVKRGEVSRRAAACPASKPRRVGDEQPDRGADRLPVGRRWLPRSAGRSSS